MEAGYFPLLAQGVQAGDRLLPITFGSGQPRGSGQCLDAGTVINYS